MTSTPQPGWPLVRERKRTPTSWLACPLAIPQNQTLGSRAPPFLEAIAEGKCFCCGASEHHGCSPSHLPAVAGCELDEDLIVLCRTCHDAEHETWEEVEEIRRRAKPAREGIY